MSITTPRAVHVADAVTAAYINELAGARQARAGAAPPRLRAPRRRRRADHARRQPIGLAAGALAPSLCPG